MEHENIEGTEAPSRRDLLRGGGAVGAMVWVAPAVAGVHVAQASPSAPVRGHAISFVAIVYDQLDSSGSVVVSTHLLKADFGGGQLGGGWTVETDNPKLPSCEDVGGGETSRYEEGDRDVIDPTGPLSDVGASWLAELDADGEPQRVTFGLADGYDLREVFVKCGQDCVAVSASSLRRTFDGKYVVDNCATYLNGSSGV